MRRTCVTCHQPFDDTEPRPSYARGNMCNECSRPQTTDAQLNKWDNEIQLETSDGRVLTFDIVKRMTTKPEKVK